MKTRIINNNRRSCKSSCLKLYELRKLQILFNAVLIVVAFAAGILTSYFRFISIVEKTTKMKIMQIHELYLVKNGRLKIWASLRHFNRRGGAKLFFLPSPPFCPLPSQSLPLLSSPPCCSLLPPLPFPSFPPLRVRGHSSRENFCYIRDARR